MAAAGLTEPRCASERGLAMGDGCPAERRFTVGDSGKSVARCLHGARVLEVRIHLPPADSLVSRRNSAVTVEKPRFSASVAGRSSQRGRQRRARRGDMAPTGDNISVGSDSGTAAPVMLVAVAIPWVL